MAWTQTRQTRMGPRKANKYNTKKVEFRGIIFDSQGEADRYLVLLDRQAQGGIRDLEIQVRYTLQPAFTDNQGKKQRAIEYLADFTYHEGTSLIIEDYKGFETKDFKIKRKMLLFLLRDRPDIIFRVTRRETLHS